MNEAIQRFRKKALAVGLLAAVATGAGFVVAGRAQFFQSYLLGYFYVLAFAGGSLAFLMIHHLAGGRWGFCLQRPFEAAARTFPFLVVLFVPVLFGMNDLYSWLHDAPAVEPLLRIKQHYLNAPAFYVRAAIYFAIWILLAALLSANSKRQDDNPERAKEFDLRLRKISGIGLVIFGLTMTFASFDWAMSLEPKWYSTIYGALFLVGQGLSAMCLMAFVGHGLVKADRTYAHVITRQQFHDVGNLIFAQIILWTYMSIGQYIIIWSGNLPEEVAYYLHRAHGVWPWVTLVLSVFHFAVPFLLLLMKSFKKQSRILIRIAALILVMRLVDYFWLEMPGLRADHFYVHWMDVTAPVALFGIWLYVFLGQLQSRPLLPLHDPRFAHILAHPDEVDESWEADATDA